MNVEEASCQCRQIDSDIVIDMDFELSVERLMEISEIDFSKIPTCCTQTCEDYWDLYWSLDIDVLFRGAFLLV